MYGLQHGALAHTEQQAVKGPNIYKKKQETRNTYKLHEQTTTTVHQIPDLGQVLNVAS